MNDWNVVITVHERNLSAALVLLRDYGRVSKTEYFNVAAMQFDDPHSLLEQLRQQAAADSGLLTILARVVPADHAFNFQTAEEFEEKAKAIVLQLVPELAGKRFHVRMHRRGFKGRLSSMEEEKFLDDILLAALDEREALGGIEFADPDAIVSVETIGQRAGISLWTREDMKRYPLLGLD